MKNEARKALMSALIDVWGEEMAAGVPEQNEQDCRAMSDDELLDYAMKEVADAKEAGLGGEEPFLSLETAVDSCLGS